MVTRAAALDIPQGPTQQGWSYSEYGGIDVLKFGEVSLPPLQPDQVLIKVAAAALNPVDFKRRLGKFQASDSPLPTVPGYDVAGTVVQVGSSVSIFKPGDEVYSNVSEAALNQPKQVGSLAQYTAVEERLVALKPKNLSFEQAAAVPLAALTAHEAFERAGFREGQSVLVINGAGGVGTFAVQIAKSVFGAAKVDATASSSKSDLLRSLSVDRVIDYKTEDYTTLEERYDFVLDCQGEGERAAKVVKEGGSVICLTGAAPPPASRFVVTSSGERLAKLTPFFERLDLRVVVDPKSPFAFSDVKAAFAHLEGGHATGKIVIAPIS